MNIPAFIAIPIRAVIFTVGLLCFGIYLVGDAICGGIRWWWEQVKG